VYDEQRAATAHTLRVEVRVLLWDTRIDKRAKQAANGGAANGANGCACHSRCGCANCGCEWPGRDNWANARNCQGTKANKQPKDTAGRSADARAGCRAITCLANSLSCVMFPRDKAHIIAGNTNTDDLANCALCCISGIEKANNCFIHGSPPFTRAYPAALPY